jgi:tryptophan halogenase
VPARDPAAQAVTLPDGRLLVRHAGGLTLLHNVAAEDLERLLERVDGTRTVAEICASLAGEYDPEDVRRLLSHLTGDLIHVVRPAPDGPPVLLLADGPAADRLSAVLGQAGLQVVGAASTPLQDAALVLCAREEVSYGELATLQSTFLDAGIPSLFITSDPDGVRVGPSTIPGASPCFGCAQLAALGSLQSSPGDALAAAAGFRSGRLQGPTLERAAMAAAAEARALLDPSGEPALLFQLLQIPPEALRPVERHPDCPLCGALAAAPSLPALHAGRLRVESEERRPPRSSPDGEGFAASVGILGGGTAGYLTALALRRKVPGLSVTLIESSDVPIIGVGEATTPLMPQFLHVDLGLDVHHLFRSVQPTFKLGIRFLWGMPGDGDFNYPFGPVRVLEPWVYEGHLRTCSLGSLLMTAGAVPLYEEGSALVSRLGTSVAYHLDNERFVAYLQRRAMEAGVERIDARIVEVERSEDGGEVRALLAADGRRLAFDLYVDASGFRSLLLKQALGSPWIGFESSLWTDGAIVAPVPHGGRVRPYTTAETLSSGWCWSTPQEDCDHRGYVFASAFQSAEEAEAEMRRSNPGMGEARRVRFRAGRHAHFWRGNVVALGNAYGFVEPLESTALHLLVRQIGLLARSFPVRRGDRGLPEQLNRKVGAWWDYLRWFLAIHYRFNRRMDSPFWRACREDVDVSSHAELIAAFHERGPLSCDPAARSFYDYPDPLWGPEGIDTLLLGQGVQGRLPRPGLSREAWAERMQRQRVLVTRAERHERALKLLAARPELLETMAEAFRAAGAAFGG